jgi:hypothetical protein
MLILKLLSEIKLIYNFLMWILLPKNPPVSATRLHRKQNAKFPLCILTEAPCLEDVGEVEVEIHAFLTSAPDRGELSASHSGRFTR